MGKLQTFERKIKKDNFKVILFDNLKKVMR